MTIVRANDGFSGKGRDGTPRDALPVYLPGCGWYATMTVTPTASAYAANDVMGTAQTLTWTDRDGNTFSGGGLRIISTTFQIAHTALVASEAGYNLHFYNVTPPSAHADNDAWDLPSGDRTAYQGLLALGTPVDLGSTLWVEVNNVNKQIQVSTTGTSFAELVTSAGITPTAAARNVKLFAISV